MHTFIPGNAHRRDPNPSRRDNPEVIGEAVGNACEQSGQESVYVNITEYACIETNSFPNITEENDDEIQPVDVNEQNSESEDEPKQDEFCKEVYEFKI